MRVVSRWGHMAGLEMFGVNLVAFFQPLSHSLPVPSNGLEGHRDNCGNRQRNTQSVKVLRFCEHRLKINKGRSESCRKACHVQNHMFCGSVLIIEHM